ncbi:leucine-rich repeat-containing protein 43-like isoform X3 [Mercenaria mercenaria]|uniref:leucine-rich repeat-containing protein 43-like isoform X3 n=1 Tax=Mercenaria mercenaria TaxID=6596 RepID=UPI00234EA8A4|nr:leucine-rich repeat-containing protein 43-like isoform X3 [Mercenaria mercenaria]
MHLASKWSRLLTTKIYEETRQFNEFELMAVEQQTHPAFTAFEKQLKTLCLREFPCGPGTWRETPPGKLKTLKSSLKVESKYSVTLKDYGAQHEKTETLEEYVGSAKSPWHLDYSWSQEARQLREISVKSPWLIDDNFVLSYFKTLRIVGKNVTYIDSNLLKFKNLEELTLSCNLISEIDSRCLPSNLKVLEACANEVSDLSSLCAKPPKLIHLGLGYNKLSFIGDYLTGQYWPQLLSLDLSNNNLSDLLDVVRKLSSLPKLRNLVLQGNPLSLIPGYRGYTVDSLRKLSILDDIMISADERHYFKGLARRREHILDEAKVLLSVSYIKGIPVPDEIKNPEDQPEFPVIERKYFVQFMFLEDQTLKFEGQHMAREDELGEITEISGYPTDRTELTETAEMQSTVGDPTLVEKNVLFTQEPHVTHTIDNTGDAVVPETTQDLKDEKKEETETEVRTVKTAPVDSEKHVWAEEVECNWSQAVVRDDLLLLRDFFKQGMQISVVEEMTLSYPVIPEETEEVASTKTEGYPVETSTPVAGKASAKDKKKEKEEKTKAGGKDKGGNEKKKKKGEPEQELKKNPPTYTTLATWHVPLADFLEGEFEFQSVFTQGGVEVASTVRSMDTDSARKHSRLGDIPSLRCSNMKSACDGKKGDSKDKGKKPPSAGKKKDESKDKSKDRKSSAGKGGKDGKGDKGKGGKAVPAAPADDEEDPGPPPPLEIHVVVQLHHWKTAMDLLKDEEAKKKEEDNQTEIQ